MTPTATNLKTQGNLYFKSGHITKAAECYKKAEAAAPNDAVYPSNLSAALYEMGDYAACFEAICRSVKRLPEPDANPSLSLRLSTRLAKSLSYGVRSGTISSDVLQQSSGAIQALERKFNEALSKSSEVPGDTVRAWKDWKRVEKEIEAVSRGRDAAQDRLVRIPIAKKAADPVLEYYTVRLYMNNFSGELLSVYSLAKTT